VQLQQDRRQTLTEFIKEGEVNLKHGERYDLTDTLFERSADELFIV
jgi:hypothetical protein